MHSSTTQDIVSSFVLVLSPSWLERCRVS